MAVESEDSLAEKNESPSLPIRTKQPKQQLTAGMEHMRAYVTIPDQPAVSEQGEDTYGVPATFQPIRQTPSRPSDTSNQQKRSDPFQFGTRYLEEGDDIFTHNAWDHVEVDPAYTSFIEAQTAFQRENGVSEFNKQRFNSAPDKWWDRFYSNNAANFFKDRKWLVQEFPILAEVTSESYGPCSVLEIGAGAGNTAFPLLEMNKNDGLQLMACDYSRKAIEIIKTQKAYLEQERPILQAEVWDVSAPELPSGSQAGKVDIIILIFIFSALSPDQWNRALSNIYTLLKPGGLVLFRDYGRGDLAQVRFKKERYLDENFYVRGDGTRVYFFAEEELRRIFTGDRGAPGFEIEQLATDRRMLVNRQRKLKMYRCWMQGKFRKPIGDSAAPEAING